MKRILRRPLLGIILIVGQLAGALAAVPPEVQAAPASEELRGRLGTVGVVGANFAPEQKLRTPARGAPGAVGRGMAKGAVSGAGPGMMLCYGGPFLCLFGLVGAAAGSVVGAVAGGMYGGVAALPAESVDEAEAALTAAPADLKAHETLRDHVIALARDQAGRALEPILAGGPSTPEDLPRYQSLTGIESVLETRIVKMGLVGKWEVNPSLSLAVSAQTRLVRVADGAELHHMALEYHSPTRQFTEWAARAAQPFLDEIHYAMRVFAERIVEDLFLVHDPWQPAPGQR